MRLPLPVALLWERDESIKWQRAAPETTAQRKNGGTSEPVRWASLPAHSKDAIRKRVFFRAHEKDEPRKGKGARERFRKCCVSSERATRKRVDGPQNTLGSVLRDGQIVGPAHEKIGFIRHSSSGGTCRMTNAISQRYTIT